MFDNLTQFVVNTLLDEGDEDDEEEEGDEEEEDDEEELRSKDENEDPEKASGTRVKGKTSKSLSKVNLN